MFKISLDQLTDLFSLISEHRELYMPIEKKGHVQFDKWDRHSKVRLDQLNTIKSVKDLFFPQSENLVAFKTDGKNISIIENRDETKPFVIFGVRACDGKGFKVLDKVFLAQPVDTYYKTRREIGIVVTMACNQPEETCFCNVFGVDATEPCGDVATWTIGDMLYLKVLTKKGEALIETVKALLKNVSDSDMAILESHRKGVKEIIGKLPFSNLTLEGFDSEHLNRKFSSPVWEELSEACIGCGTCTFICPTCQCYDIRDYDTGHGIQRFRCWDSCMYSDFTRMAHGNPRLTQLERFRQRFMHKLIYFPENNDGEYSCVGCGRCLAKCPVSMNIVKVIKALEADENE